ncbi:L,D-transpeptidase family protein [Candidatus Saccharibacteria bacterium]|nr:L,D-transpeptidase family protein [Candidatus Saccharibacteria bacterium]
MNKIRKITSFLLSFAIILWNPLTIYAEEEKPLNSKVSEEVSTEQVAVEPTITLGPPVAITVYRKSNVCGIYDANGQLIKAFFVSTGKPGHQTPLGTYQIYQHTDNGDYHLMVDGTYARFCMRFKEGGYMFHSVCYANKGDKEPIPQEVTDIGTSVSRGCVRLNVADAEWLYNNIPNGCLVVILDY